MIDTRPFTPGDLVTIVHDGSVYEVISVHDEKFQIGGMQQVCRITNERRTFTMRAAHLTLKEARQ